MNGKRFCAFVDILKFLFAISEVVNVNVNYTFTKEVSYFPFHFMSRTMKMKGRDLVDV